MNSRTWFLLGAAFIIYSSSFAQNPLVEEWNNRFGADSTEEINYIIQTRDNGFLLGGGTISDSNQDVSQPSFGNWDFWVVKTDSEGNKEWDKRFGGNDEDDLTVVQQTKDGGYIFGGWSASDSSGDVSEVGRGGFDYWIIKTDSVGNKQWDKRFGGSNNDVLNALQQTSDGGYILGGSSWSGVSGDKTQPNWDTTEEWEDFWVVKTDSIGNKEWDKRFGGLYPDDLYSLQQTKDGGYILGGFTDSDSGDDVSQHYRGDIDYWIVKIDTKGNKLWDKRFGGIEGLSYIYSLQETADGGFILGGQIYADSAGLDVSEPTRGDWDYWIVKTDSAGNKKWDKRFGGNQEDLFWGYVRQTTDNGYLLSGCSFSNISGDKSENNLGYFETWIVKTDTIGSKQWDKTVSVGQAATIPAFSYAIQSTNNGYLVCTSPNSGPAGYDTKPSKGSWDYWIAKFDDSSLHCSSLPVKVDVTQKTTCAADTAIICASKGLLKYQWNTGENSNCIVAYDSGSFYVIGTDYNGCSAQSNQIVIPPFHLVVASIKISEDTLFASGQGSYQWYENDTMLKNADSEFLVVNGSGSYMVEVIDSNGCSAISNPVIVTGIIESKKNGIEVFPNPTFNDWQLKADDEFIGSDFEILNEQGRIVTKSKITSTETSIHFDALSGIYFLKIFTTQSTITKKLVRL